MNDAKFPKYLNALKRNKERSARNKEPGREPGQESGQGSAEPELEPCCQGTVHIAYRGVSDDRMYMSRDRSFNEIKFFRPHGLRVFCAGCRRRLA